MSASRTILLVAIIGFACAQSPSAFGGPPPRETRLNMRRAPISTCLMSAVNTRVQVGDRIGAVLLRWYYTHYYGGAWTVNTEAE